MVCSHYSAIVIDKRAIVGRIGLGAPALGVEQLVQRGIADFEQRTDGVDFVDRCDPSVEVSLRCRVVEVNVADCIAQLMRNF